MALTIKPRLWSEYPIPEAISIWGGDGIATFPISDLDTLIETCIDELASDLAITDYQVVNSMTAYLPSDTVGVVAARLNFGFQGNRNVKATYNPYNKTVNVRYYPAVVTFKRRLTVANVNKLRGDQLIYLKDYILYKMAEKELTTLGSVKLDADNGALDLAALQEFRDKHRDNYLERKQDILIYNVGN